MKGGAQSGAAGPVRKFFVGAGFALVLLIPKVLRLRRNPRVWLALRILLGLAGAALVLIPLRLRDNWLWSVVGVALFAAAVLLRPASRLPSADEKARELGALVVVNGGEFQGQRGDAVAVQLFAGRETIWALDAHLREVVTIRVAEIRALRALRGEEDSRLQIEEHENAAEFVYRGFFAQHLAEVAETTLRSLLRLPLPMIPEKPQRRAAGA